MAAPVKPTPPTPHASRSSPSTFPALADATIDYALVDGPDYVEAAADYAETQADAALAAAVAGNLSGLDLAALAGGVIGVNTGGTALEGIDGKVSEHAGSYTLLTGDRGKTHVFTATGTMTMLTAAAAGNGYSCPVIVEGGILTLSGDVNGITNFKMYPGEEGRLISDGTDWRIGGLGLLPRGTWETVETLDGATGSPTALTTSDFDVGYDYRFVIHGISHNDGGARRIAADFYGVTLAGYVTQSSTWTTAPLVYSLAAQVAANLFDGVAEIESPRNAKDIHILSTSGHDEAAGYGDPLVRVPTRGDVMCTFFAADDAVQKIKFTWTGGVAFDAGTIRVEKRLSSA